VSKSMQTKQKDTKRSYLALFKRFSSIDAKIWHNFLRRGSNSFAALWVTQKDYTKHIKKRLKRKEIASKGDYFQKSLHTFISPIAIYYLASKDPHGEDKIFYIADSWVDIVLDNAKLLTSFPRKVSLERLLQDPKNRGYFITPIPLPLHKPKKVIMYKKIPKDSDAVHNSS